MGHGTEEVCWVERRNPEATAILRLSTMRLDQKSYDKKIYVFGWTWAMKIVMSPLYMLRREPVELGREVGSLLHDRQNNNHYSSDTREIHIIVRKRQDATLFLSLY